MTDPIAPTPLPGTNANGATATDPAAMNGASGQPGAFEALFAAQIGARAQMPAEAANPGLAPEIKPQVAAPVIEPALPVLAESGKLPETGKVLPANRPLPLALAAFAGPAMLVAKPAIAKPANDDSDAASDRASDTAQLVPDAAPMLVLANLPIPVTAALPELSPDGSPRAAAGPAARPATLAIARVNPASNATPLPPPVAVPADPLTTPALAITLPLIRATNPAPMPAAEAPAEAPPAPPANDTVPAIPRDAALASTIVPATAPALSPMAGATRPSASAAIRESSASPSGQGDLGPGQPPMAVSALMSPAGPSPVVSPEATSGPATPATPDMTALVDRLVEARAAARSSAAPVGVTTAVRHADFGRVSLRFDQQDGALSVSMASADPAFAPAVHTALAASAKSAQAGSNDQPGAQPQRFVPAPSGFAAQADGGGARQGQPQPRAQAPAPAFATASRSTPAPSGDGNATPAGLFA